MISICSLITIMILFKFKKFFFRLYLSADFCRDCDQHGPGSKPTPVILLCPWERHFTTLFPAWWSWQAVVN